LCDSKGSRDAASIKSGSAHCKEDDYSNPSFIFLQLYNSKFLGDNQTDLPILVPANEVLKILSVLETEIIFEVPR